MSYEFDTILNFNTFTQAFYPWTVTNSPVKLNAVIVLDSESGAVSINTIVDGSANPVVDSGANSLISFDSTSSQGSAAHKYLVSYPSSGSYNFTFAEEINTDCVDWFQFDTIGASYDSYFITGYIVRGEATRLFQPNWIAVYSRLDQPVAYYFQGVWNYALTGSGTGQFGTKQFVTHDSDGTYAYKHRRLRVRGHGTVLQYKVQSVDNNFFDIIGWSTIDIGNQQP